MTGMVAKQLEDRPGVGIAMVLVAYFLFSFVDTSVKWMLLIGFHAFQLAFLRYFSHFIISLIRIGQGGFTRRRFATSHLGLVLLRSGFLVVTTVGNFIALKYLSLTITSAIMFSAPMIICALSWPLLGERVGPWRWFAIILGFGGVLVIIRPFGESFHLAAFLAVFNSLNFALYSILTRKLSGVVAIATMQFYSGAVGTVVTLPLAVMTWQNPTSVLEAGLMIGLGAFAWAGHEFLTRAHGYGSANAMMPYSYSFLIYLTIASYLVFNQLPDGYTILGAVIIVFSGLIIWIRESRREAVK